MEKLSHRIPPAAVQRVATQQASDCLSTAAPHAESLNGIMSVFRTGGGKAASRRQPGRDYKLVRSEQGQHETASQRSAHRTTPSNDKSSALNSSNARVDTELRGFTTISMLRGSLGRAVRNISRTRRLIRFLSCAGPNLRGVVSPKRQ